MAAFLIFFLLFFLPSVVIPVGISPFETPKVILAQILIEVLLFSKIIQFKKPHFKNLITPQVIFIGILFILSLDTQLLFQPEGAFFGNVFRLQGQFLFWHLLLFSILSKTIKLDKIPKFFYHLSFICLVMGTLILGVNQNNRAFGTLGEPNALAATALFIFPFAWFNAKSLIRGSSLLATLAIILLSGSRAGLIGLIIQSVSIIFKSFSLSKGVIVSLILMVLSLVFPFTEKAGWFALAQPVFENRAEIWQTAFMAGLKSPFIGHGFGNIQSTIHQEAVLINNNVQYQIVDSAHNFLLDFWIQGGLVGVMSILILIYLALQHFIQSRKLLEITALLGLITAMLFNPVSVVNLVAFWWLIGRGFAD